MAALVPITFQQQILTGSRDSVNCEISTAGVSGEVGFAIGEIPEVQAVFTRKEDRLVRVWTIISEAKSEIKRRVYNKEKEIIDAYPDLEFDFRVIVSRGRDPRDLLAEGTDFAYLSNAFAPR